MSGHGFTSAFAAQLETYLAFKQSMGCHGTSRAWYLKQFDAYCTAHASTVVDRDTVEGWVSAQLATSGRYRSWMSYIRDFGRWLRAHGHTNAYVLSDNWKAGSVPAHPYLLAGHEIEAFFDTAAQLDAGSPWRWQAVAFFTLMHSCGLRTGETRALQPDQVDLSGRQVEVLWSKANRSRRLPITPDVAAVLASCDRISRKQVGPARSRFFVSSTGNPVSPASVGVIFNRIWDQAGLSRQEGGTRPRPYDFRHNFAYANLERWMTEGLDVAAMLPYLSAYMGHATIESTYYYVHTSPDFLSNYARITAASAALLPEVGFG